MKSPITRQKVILFHKRKYKNKTQRKTNKFLSSPLFHLLTSAQHLQVPIPIIIKNKESKGVVIVHIQIER